MVLSYCWTWPRVWASLTKQKHFHSEPTTHSGLSQRLKKKKGKKKKKKKRSQLCSQLTGQFPKHDKKEKMGAAAHLLRVWTFTKLERNAHEMTLNTEWVLSMPSDSRWRSCAAIAKSISMQWTREGASVSTEVLTDWGGSRWKFRRR